MCSITDACWKRTAKVMSRSYGKCTACLDESLSRSVTLSLFLEAITNASACNKLLCKKFLKPDNIGLIPTGGYSDNVNYSKKSLMWLVYREKTDGDAIYCTGVMDANTSCRKSPTLVSTVSARKQGPCTNFSAITTTVILAKPTVTSLQIEGIPC